MFLRNKKVLNMADPRENDNVEQTEENTMEQSQERGEVNSQVDQEAVGYVVILQETDIPIEGDSQMRETESGLVQSGGSELIAGNENRQEGMNRQSNENNDLRDLLAGILNQMKEADKSLKQSQAEIKNEVKLQIEQSQAVIKTEISTVRAEVNSRIDGLKNEVTERVNSLLAETNSRIDNIQVIVDQNRSMVNGRIESVAEASTKLVTNLEEGVKTQIVNLENKLEVINKRVKCNEQRLISHEKETQDCFEKVENMIENSSNLNKPSTSNTNSKTGNTNKTNQSRNDRPTSSPGSKSDNNVANNVLPGELQTKQNLLSFSLGEIPLPRYGDKNNEHPIKFIRDLEQFFVLRMVPLELRKSVLCHALYDDPLIWADIQNFEDCSYEQVKEQLLSQF